MNEPVRRQGNGWPQKLMSCFCVGMGTQITPASAQHVAEPVLEISIGAGNRGALRLQKFDDEESDIVIDGQLSERAWDLPPLNDDLKLITPDTLAKAPHDTRLRIFYTERGLYFSVDMDQPQDTIIERDTARDNVEENRDHVSLSFDTSGTGVYGYWMNLALGDNLADGTLLPERQYIREWDGAWYGATARTSTGWSAEAFVPWSQLSMPNSEGERRIGVYISRKVAHLNELWAWPSLPKSQPRFMSILPKFELTGVDPRQQWSFFPFVSATFDNIEDSIHYKSGADVFWRPSTNFQLAGTFNPDFGSVESDDVVVNLTADETFFPEKRLFFLEGQDIFNTTFRSTSTSGQRFTVVNTRRIGGRARPPELLTGANLPLRQAVRPSDLVGAAKTTGQLGAFRFGAIAAFEDESVFNVNDQLFVQQGREFGALRFLYEDDKSASYRGLGFISTLVAHPDANAVVHAADFHFLSRSGRWNIDGQVLASDRDESGTGYGTYADITFTPSQGVKHILELTVFDDKLDVNDFGFQRRNDVREAWYRMEWIRSGLTHLRNFTISPFLRYEVNGDGFRTNNAIASNFDFKLNNLDEIEVFAAHFPKRFDDRNSFGNGVFDVAERQQFSVLYRTDTARPLSVYGKLGFMGEFTGGETYEVEAGATWRPRSYFGIELSARFFDRNGWLLHQEGKSFTTFNATQWQPALSADYFLSARQHLSLALQWVGIRATEKQFYTLLDDSTAMVRGPKPPGPRDDFSLSQLNFQLRYRWQIAPLSDVFVVYTKGDSRRRSLSAFSDLFQDSWDEPLGDQLVIKLRYRLGT